MILDNRQYERPAPTRDAHLIIIYCEGHKTEPGYFRYFQQISSRIRLEVIASGHEENNSPTGLLKKARQEHSATLNQKVEKGWQKDQLWFVIDTDQWGEKITHLRNEISRYDNWQVAQSNPSFEVWLYYHFHKNKPEFNGMEHSQQWKSYVNKRIPGGFDPRKHPIHVEKAMQNAKKAFSKTPEGQVDLACTEVYLLAESFYPFIKKMIADRLHHPGENYGLS